MKLRIRIPICTLYDIGSQDGVDFLVMERLEGETLMDQTARGPMPVTKAIPLALTLVTTLEQRGRSTPM